MAIIFDELLDRAERNGILYRENMKKASRWFRNRAQEASSVSSTGLLRGAGNRRTTAFGPGKMYMFRYDPKWKNELPYYDTFPVMFPIEVSGKYILGLNLHYLPPRMRAQFMDRLWALRNNNKYDETTKLKLSYQLLSGSSRYKFFRPAIKQYLVKHVRSKLIEIDANEWDIAMMLPVASFKKASSGKVWADSRKMIR